MNTSKVHEEVNKLLKDIKEQKESIKKCSYYDGDDVIRMLDALTKRIGKILQYVEEV